ncbi:MAG: succinylglutamate desuccinylase/aspartoacylase family protein [Myxococcota bacterium]
MIPTIATLDLESLDPGFHRFGLALVEDELGRDLRLPLIVARGRHPGPTLGITAAVHGDEVNGIPVIHRLVEKTGTDRLRGTLVCLPIVNVPAYRQHSRRGPQGFDLNHHFPGAADGHEVQVYAHRLMRSVIEKLNLLLDLHTASRGRVNCLYIRANMNNPVTRRMAYLQRPQIILHNPASDGTLRGAAQDLGIPSITVEIGNPSRVQSEYTRRAVRGIRAVMAEHGMISKRPEKLGPEPILCRESQWLYTTRGGLLTVHPQLLQAVEQGEVIATVVDAFGRVTARYTAPFSGIVIGRAVDPVAATGARILHLGRIDASLAGAP